MLAVRDLTFDYETHRALHAVSAIVPARSITALVGPNGAGKTTLMRCVAALEPPFAGSITLDGLDVVAEPRAARARIGFLQDLFGLYDRLTVRRCLDYAAAARRVPRDRAPARIAALADALGLAPLLARRAGELSRGQRQRLGIAQAIVHDPAVLILDEPASGLDPEARIELAQLLRALRGEGMTILVSSHILAELADYSTHLMVMDAGRVVSMGALGAVAADARRLRLVLAGPAELGPLAAQPGVSAVVAEDQGARFDFAGDLAAQAALLARMVQAGVPVAGLAEVGADLQQAYLDQVRTARAQPGTRG
jgi:ABC-2 type transport system ATP-binding protein